MDFGQRIDCWEHTRQLCVSKNIPLPPRSIKRTLDPNFPNSNPNSNSTKDNTSFRVWIENQDAIDLAITIVKSGAVKRPLILNLSDDCFAGGCVAQGSGAQEESLFRRSNYFQTLVQTNDFYPIRDTECVYSPAVTILKSSERSGWQMYPPNQRPVFSFLACPGLKFPDTEPDPQTGEERLLPQDVEILRGKILVILQTAVRYGHDSLVLGALGCGAWRNPPKHVAEIFKQVLQENAALVPPFVFFAILNTKDDNFIIRRHMDASPPTHQIFSKVFSA